MKERQRRRFKSFAKLLIAACFFWLLIVYGFSEESADLDFGEHLDNAHNDRFKLENRKPFLKFINNNLANEKEESEESQLSSSEMRILSEFLKTERPKIQNDPQPVKIVDVPLDENLILNKFLAPKPTSIVYKETLGPNGSFEDENVEENWRNLPQNDDKVNLEILGNEMNPQEKYNLMKNEIEMIKDQLPAEHVKILMDELEKNNPEKNKVKEEPNLNELIPKVHEDSRPNFEQLIPNNADVPLPDQKADLDEAEVAMEKIKPIGPPRESEVEEVKNTTKSVDNKNADLETFERPLKSKSASKESAEEQKNSKESDEKETKIEEVVANELEKLGEYGEAVTLPDEIPENIKQLVKVGWDHYEFNEYVSSLISLQRDLHDFRSDYCKDAHRNYSSNLPTVSIIIVFYNEAWSTLLRSIYSIFNRTPLHFIQEIILVDDFSEFQNLKEPLYEFSKQFPKV